jgi:hypothetical protein
LLRKNLGRSWPKAGIISVYLRNSFNPTYANA